MELILPQNYELINKNEAKQTIAGGKVGFRVYISDGVRTLGAIGGGAVVAGAVASSIALIAAPTGPIGAGVATALSTAAGGVAGYAIEHNWKFCDIVTNVPFVNDHITELHV